MTGTFSLLRLVWNSIESIEYSSTSPRDMHRRLIGDPAPRHECVSEWCVAPAMDWQPLQGLLRLQVCAYVVGKNLTVSYCHKHRLVLVAYTKVCHTLNRAVFTYHIIWPMRSTVGQSSQMGLGISWVLVVLVFYGMDHFMSIYLILSVIASSNLFVRCGCCCITLLFLWCNDQLIQELCFIFFHGSFSDVIFLFIFAITHTRHTFSRPGAKTSWRQINNKYIIYRLSASKMFDLLRSIFMSVLFFVIRNVFGIQILESKSDIKCKNALYINKISVFKYQSRSKSKCIYTCTV